MSPLAAPTPINVPSADEFEQMYREHAPLVYRTAWGVLGSREDAEDVLQAVFLKLLRRELALGLHKNPKAYLYKSAVTVSLDVLKARRRRPALVDVGDIERLEVSAPASNARFDEATHERLYEAIAKLSAEAAELLVLRYMDSTSIAEIAKKLGVSRTVIVVRLFRSRARLRALLCVPSEKKS
jgi:RNA polymerase sigma-70 factor (ECF subfamily)